MPKGWQIWLIDFISALVGVGLLLKVSLGLGVFVLSVCGLLTVWGLVDWIGSINAKRREPIVEFRKRYLSELDETLNKIRTRSQQIVREASQHSLDEYEKLYFSGRKHAMDWSKYKDKNEAILVEIGLLFVNNSPPVNNPLLMSLNEHDERLRPLLERLEELRNSIGDAALNELISCYLTMAGHADSNDLYHLMEKNYSVGLTIEELEGMRRGHDELLENLRTLRVSITRRIEALLQGTDITIWQWN